MASWRIPLYKIYWDEADVNRVLEVIRQGMFWATGPNIEQFETLVAEYLDREYAVAFNSGTSALHALLLACGIKAGDEVIVPSFTFIATSNSVLFVNAKPVFADIEKETYGLDPEDVESRITGKTKAIMLSEPESMESLWAPSATPRCSASAGIRSSRLERAG